MLNLSNTNKKFTYLLPSVMWLLSVLLFAYQYLLQVSPGVMTQDLMRDFNVNATALGSLAGCYFYPYALMQIPSGLALDHYGAQRPLLPIAAFICALGCFLFAATSLFALTVIGRLLIGASGAFAFVGGLYIAETRLPSRLFAFLAGTAVTIGMVGASCGQAPLALVINVLSWRNTMFLLSGIGLLLAAAMWLVMRHTPKIQPISHNTSVPLHSSILSSLKNVINNRQIWLLAIYGGLMFMPFSVFGALWGTPFLMHKYHITNAAAGSMVTMLFLGLAVGSPFCGWFSDQIKRRKIVMVISACGGLISILGIIYLPLPTYATSSLLFVYSFCAGGSLVCFPAVKESNHTNNTGAAMGFTNALNMVGSAVMQPIVGAILDWQWNGVIKDGVRVYTLVNFEIALILLPICIALAILFSLLTKETYQHK